MLKKSLKSVIFWLIFLPLFYALSGFVILPWWAQNELPSLLKEKLNLNISIEKVLFNPFTFELHINKFALKNDAEEKVASVDHLYVNYELSSLFKKEFFVKSLLIEKPFVDLKIAPNGTLNLLTLFPKTKSTSDTNTTKANSLVMPFLIEHIEILNGEAFFSDDRSTEPFKIAFGPINYVVNNLGFHKDDLSIHALKIAFQNEEKITLASSASIEPLKFYGELGIEDLPLVLFWKYLLPNIPATLSQGDLSLKIPFSIDLSKEKPLVSLEKASAALEHIRFIDKDQKTIIEVPALKLDAIDFDLQTSNVSIEKAMISKPFVNVTLEKNYALNLVRLFVPINMPAQTKPETSSKQETNNSWKFALKTLQINEASIDVTDQNVKSTVVHLTPLNLTAQNLTQNMNSAISYDLNSKIDTTASLNLKGTFVPTTTSLELVISANALSLEKAQPYISPFTTTLIQDGSLSLNSKIKASFDQQMTFKIEGDATISKFSLADKSKQPLVAWETLNVANVSYTLTPATLSIQNIMMDKPYVNLDIKKDGMTNFSDILKTSSTPTPPSKAKKVPVTQDAMSIYIGNIVFKRGTTHFQDASLLLPFATFADRLNGNISTLDTKSTKPSVLKLEGKVDKYGYAKIEGSVLPFDFKDRANLKIIFKNIDMSSLTPYSGKFVGYAIKEGKLSTDLNYKIKKGLMEGANKINLDSLTLGDKIESEDATNLPLGLAIAILKDSKGQIDIDLPISGDLNDPDFRYGSIVWRALGNLIGNIVTSPFKLLGSLLGIETENLKSIDFAAGEYSLIDSEEEKMDQYRQILEKRNELKLIITPSFNEILDTKALQEQNITAQIETLIPKKSKEDDSYGKIIKKLYIQKYSDDAYTKLMKAYKEENLDAGVINDNLITKLSESIVITPEQLQVLAFKRSDAIVQNLITKYKISPERVLKTEPKSSDAIRDEWVGCEVTVRN